MDAMSAQTRLLERVAEAFDPANWRRQTIDEAGQEPRTGIADGEQAKDGACSPETGRRRS